MPADPPRRFADAQMPEHPRLTFDLDVDVCVIGGGLAGMSTARELALRGQEVVLVEADGVMWNASRRNCGVVMPGYSAPIDELMTRVGFDHAKSLWALADEGLAMVRALLALPDMAGVRGADGWLQVSKVDAGDELIGRLQVLGEDFGIEVEGWQRDEVRAKVASDHYFHALHFPSAMTLDPARYALALTALAQQAGVRIFSQTPVIGIDAAGIRKRIVTPAGRLRASQIVLAGNVHLGVSMERLAATLMPVFTDVALSAPLGGRLGELIKYKGAISGPHASDEMFRIVDGDRLLWSERSAVWSRKPESYAETARRQIARRFPELRGLTIETTWSGVTGHTVHGMPQIGQIREGVWVASGFGRHGLGNTALAARLIADGAVAGDDRWRLFSPFELVWAGGTIGRVAAQAMIGFSRLSHETQAATSRQRERMAARERAREARLKAVTEAAQRRAQQASASRPEADH